MNARAGVSTIIGCCPGTSNDRFLIAVPRSDDITKGNYGSRIAIIGSRGSNGIGWCGGFITLNGNISRACNNRRTGIYDSNYLDARAGVSTIIGSCPCTCDDGFLITGSSSDDITKGNYKSRITIIGS